MGEISAEIQVAESNENGEIKPARIKGSVRVWPAVIAGTLIAASIGNFANDTTHLPGQPEDPTFTPFTPKDQDGHPVSGRDGNPLQCYYLHDGQNAGVIDTICDFSAPSTTQG